MTDSPQRILRDEKSCGNLEDENDRSKQTGPGSPGRDFGEDYDNFEDDHEYYDGEDDSDKDFTAYNSEHFGNCGRCDY